MTMASQMQTQIVRHIHHKSVWALAPSRRSARPNVQRGRDTYGASEVRAANLRALPGAKAIAALSPRSEDLRHQRILQLRWRRCAHRSHAYDAQSHGLPARYMPLPISIFLANVLPPWYTSASMRPVTVKTPPMMAHIWVRKAAKDSRFSATITCMGEMS